MTFGSEYGGGMKTDHNARARQAWPILVKRASEGEKPFSYGELCEPLGLHARSAQYFLGVIQEHCEKLKLPPLQALVVNKRTGLPGKGYYGSARSPKAHTEALKLVYARNWPRQAPF
jgi:hypothetical protein